MSIKNLFTNIAAAIKEKNTNIVTVTPGNMPQAIRDIETGLQLNYFPDINISDDPSAAYLYTTVLASDNTDDYIITSSYSIYSNYYGYKAFSNNSGWVINVNTTGNAQSLTIEFTEAKTIKGITFLTHSGTLFQTTQFTFQASNDTENWINLYEYNYQSGEASILYTDIDNNTAYKYYRFYCTASTAATGLQYVTFKL